MDQTIQKQLPGWTLEDAYGTVQDKRFQDELQKIHCEIKKLRDLLPTNPTKENVLQCLPIYEDAVEGISSLISFPTVLPVPILRIRRQPLLTRKLKLYMQNWNPSLRAPFCQAGFNSG